MGRNFDDQIQNLGEELERLREDMKKKITEEDQKAKEEMKDEIVAEILSRLGLENKKK